MGTVDAPVEAQEPSLVLVVHQGEMSTTYDYYYYDTYGTSTSYGDYYYFSSSSEASVTGSECLNYIYLVWVYFLFYVGAGYPSSYYPYIIATLVDTVPQQCGGTGGQTEGESLLASSALNLLSLQQQAASPTFNGFIGGQVQYSSGESIGSQPVVGLDSAQLFGRRKRSERVGGKRKKKLFQKMTKINEAFMSSSKRKSSSGQKGRKQSSQKTSRKQTRVRENKVSRKQSREKDKASERESARKSLRNQKRKSAKSSERKKQRKRKRKLSGEKERARKEKRRKRRKQRRTKLRRIEESRLGKPVPKKKMEMFRENFRRGKEKVGRSKILKNVENPFEKRGRLRSDFRQLVREKVIQKLPDYCEQARLEKKGEEKKADCSRRAKRIRERIEKRKKFSV